MVNVVMFDADGVLIHAKRFSAHLEEQFGIKRETTDPFFAGIFQACLTGKADLKKELVKHVDGWGWTRSIDELLRFWFQSEHVVDNEILAYINTLRQKGIRPFLATNNEKYRAAYMAQDMGFGDIFDGIYASGTMGVKKPDPAFFRYIIKEQKLPVSEALFWDDDPENVAAAKEVGLHAEVYTHFADFQKKMHTYLK